MHDFNRIILSDRTFEPRPKIHHRWPRSDARAFLTLAFLVEIVRHHGLLSPRPSAASLESPHPIMATTLGPSFAPNLTARSLGILSPRMSSP
jgi:hypothetical protein